MVEQSQEQRLMAEKQKQEKQGTMVPFSGTVIDVGIPIRKHFANLKDANGKTVKDNRGFAKKSEQSDGYAITLAAFGKKQFVQLILPKPVTLKPAMAYTVTGFGYDLGENFYIKQEPHIRNY